MTTDENGVVTTTVAVNNLDTTIKGEKTRVRETSENSRMLINSNNPLFLFRISLPILSARDTLLVRTYKAIPEDVREFSAVLVNDYNPFKGTVEELFDFYDGILDKTDKEGVPAFLQIEYWNSAIDREPFTEDQLCDLLERHPSLMGFVHNELCCEKFTQEEIDRLKNTIRACEKYGAVLIWQEMEYLWEDHINVLQLAFEDKELYDLMTNYSHNIVIQDKHNGGGRHFSVQSSAMGAWLSGACGNWGSNIEAWLWYEIGELDYSVPNIEHDEGNYIYRYPPAVAGIDTISDLVGGATVFSTEEINLYVSTFTSVKLSETFYSVIYPIYQRILEGAIPSKEEVIENVKVAYQFTTPKDSPMMGLESNLFIDSYGMSNQWYLLFGGFGRLPKWIPTTGRYYIIPSLTKYANTTEILPNADIINVNNYQQKMSYSTTNKQEYLNSKFTQTYTGDATLYSIGGLTYIFNNNEVKSQAQTANYSLETSGLDLSAKLSEHTYMILEESTDTLNIELVNLRLDSYNVCIGKQSAWSFLNSYIKGKNMDLASDFRTTEIALKGFEKMPKINVSGNNNPTATVKYDPNSRTATITVTSNGAVMIDVIK